MAIAAEIGSDLSALTELMTAHCGQLSAAAASENWSAQTLIKSTLRAFLITLLSPPDPAEGTYGYALSDVASDPAFLSDVAASFQEDVAGIIAGEAPPEIVAIVLEEIDVLVIE